MTNSLAIYTKGLIKNYGNIRALRGLDLEVQRGEIFGFLGPNGAGKTTTIRCMLDLIRPQGGTIRILDMNPQTDPVAVLARIGYLPGELSMETNLRVAVPAIAKRKMDSCFRRNDFERIKRWQNR